jgi:uncharacterized protein YjiS (DUF1127 family)
MTTLITRAARAVVPRRSGLVARIAVWMAVARQRRELLEMDERGLKDIGITRADALAEAARPFWDTGRRL